VKTKRTRTAEVVDLQRVRKRRRLDVYAGRLRTVLEMNRRALMQLFSTGLIFSRQGARAGRDLLLAYQHLLKCQDALSRIEELHAPAPDTGEAEAVYAELDALIQRTSALMHRTGDLIKGELPSR
jgi:hypothetical protein